MNEKTQNKSVKQSVLLQFKNFNYLVLNFILKLFSVTKINRILIVFVFK